MIGYYRETEGDDKSMRMWILNIMIVMSGIFLVLTYEASMTYVTRFFLNIFMFTKRFKLELYSYLQNCHQRHFQTRQSLYFNNHFWKSAFILKRMMVMA